MVGCTVGIVVVGALDGNAVGFDEGVAVVGGVVGFAVVGDAVGFVAFRIDSTTAVYDALGALSTSNRNTFRSVYAAV